MCGIYLTNLSISKSEIQSKLKKIEFRGPDFMGISHKEGISFGHLRLSIIDLDQRSNQPYEFEYLTLVYNGEIYNYLEIKIELEAIGYSFETTGDTEVLIKGFHAWGKDLVPKMNGMFSFAIYNSNTKTVFCSRDRLGVKPFYYYWNEGEFEICSQIQPISEKKEINEEALSIYLQTGYIPSPFSIFENINKLPPGTNLEINLNKKSCRTDKYWDLKPVKLCSLSYEEAKDKLHKLLIDSVRIRLQSDVPFGSFLSGGIDSALVSAIASELTKKNLKTFTIGFNDPKFDESKLAKQFSEIIGTKHTETICKPEDLLNLLPKFFKTYGEPFADSSAIPSLLLSKTTKPHVTVALSGDGGDESFFGYNHFEWSKSFDIFFKIPYKVRKIIALVFPYYLFGKRGEAINSIFLFPSFSNFIESIFIGFTSFLVKRENKWLSHFDAFKILSNNTLQQVADLNIKLWLENDSNVKVDRASMGYSVEVRSPFLDYRIIEFARSLPIHYRFDGKTRKKILKDILSEYIPKEIFEVPKKGFGIPLGSWIRNELKEEFSKSLTDKNLNQIKNLDVKKIKKYLRLHLLGKEDYSTYLWRVYVYIKWKKNLGYNESA